MAAPALPCPALPSCTSCPAAAHGSQPALGAAPAAPGSLHGRRGLWLPHRELSGLTSTLLVSSVRFCLGVPPLAWCRCLWHSLGTLYTSSGVLAMPLWGSGWVGEDPLQQLSSPWVCAELSSAVGLLNGRCHRPGSSGLRRVVPGAPALQGRVKVGCSAVPMPLPARLPPHCSPSSLHSAQ